jgi:hypothetical protein
MRKAKFSVKGLFVVSALACGLVFTNCSGGNGVSCSSTLKTNEYLGKLPALYEGYSNEIAAMEKKLEEKGEKLMAGGEKVPVTFSEKLQNPGTLFYNISDVKIVEDKGEPKISFTVTAKEDFTIASMKAYDYRIYHRLIGSNGVLENSEYTIFPVLLTREVKSFKKGDILEQASVGLNLERYASDRATLSNIEFILSEEK